MRFSPIILSIVNVAFCEFFVVTLILLEKLLVDGVSVPILHRSTVSMSVLSLPGLAVGDSERGFTCALLCAMCSVENDWA